MIQRRGGAAVVALCLVVWVSGCGDYSATTRRAREEYYAGEFSNAAKDLEKGAHEDGVDQLLYLFDRGTALYNAGDYEESIKDFRTADKLAEIKDYTSLASEAATLVSNDKIIAYKGEDFEKVLINQYLALNYLFLGNFEDALVECRRVNRKLYMMISEGKRKYKLNPMAKYISGLIFEATGQHNDAYIDYKGVFDLAPDFPGLREDLYRTAWRAGLEQEQEQWAARFSLSRTEQDEIRKAAKRSEVIVFVENGKSPEKEPHPQWRAIPRYVPRSNPVDYVDVEVEGVNRGRSHILFDIEATAIQNLDDKFAGIFAKRIAGVVVKEGIAYKVDKEVSPLAGALLRLGLYAVDQADLRSWLTLPRDFQVFRVRVAPDNVYHVKVIPKNSGGGVVSSTPVQEKVVHVGRGGDKKYFVSVRVL